eukprot:1288088-Prymnesium_polylepis.1
MNIATEISPRQHCARMLIEGCIVGVQRMVIALTEKAGQLDECRGYDVCAPSVIRRRDGLALPER